MNNLEYNTSNEGLGWSDLLKQEKEQGYFKDLLNKVALLRTKGVKVYPENKNVFQAFAATPLEKLSVVILGQDPYHGAGQAHGLSFSVTEGVPLPPSLQNIFKEIQNDIHTERPKSGDLTRWADQGVLLLNSVLTVEADKAGSHAGLGWERFTDKVIELINIHTKHTVFMLWGAYAQKKGTCIDPLKHLVLTAPHPSPLSAHRGFLGCKHFSQANEYLIRHSKNPIRW
jgi:uracil-DNA glycosylase